MTFYIYRIQNIKKIASYLLDYEEILTNSPNSLSIMQKMLFVIFYYVK